MKTDIKSKYTYRLASRQNLQMLGVLSLFLTACELKEVHQTAEIGNVATFATSFDLGLVKDEINDAVLAADNSIFMVGSLFDQPFNPKAFIHRVDQQGKAITTNFPGKLDINYRNKGGQWVTFKNESLSSVAQTASGSYVFCGNVFFDDGLSSSNGDYRTGFYAFTPENTTEAGYISPVFDPLTETTYHAYNYTFVAFTGNNYVTLLGESDDAEIRYSIRMLRIDPATGNIVAGFPKKIDVPYTCAFSVVDFAEVTSGGDLIVLGGGDELSGCDDGSNGFLIKLSAEGAVVKGQAPLTPLEPLRNLRPYPTRLIPLRNGKFAVLGNIRKTPGDIEPRGFLLLVDNNLNFLSEPVYFGSDVFGKYFRLTDGIQTASGKLALVGSTNINGALGSACLIFTDENGKELPGNARNIYDFTAEGDLTLPQTGAGESHLNVVLELPDETLFMAGYVADDMLVIKTDRNGRLH